MIYLGVYKSRLSGTIRYEDITVEQFNRMRAELGKIFGEDSVKVTDKPFKYCKGYGELIRNRRVELGMSMRALAKASGVNVSSLSRYQNGTINLTDETLKKVMDALGLTEEDLKGDTIERTENADHDLGEDADDSESSEDRSDLEEDI